MVAERLDDGSENGKLDWAGRMTYCLRLTDENVAKIVRVSDRDGMEVFFTPVPRSAKGDPSAENAGVPRTIYADVDKSALPARTLAWLRRQGACLVRSGGVVLTESGKEVLRYHVHLPLDVTRSTPAHHEVEQLNQALSKRLGGDSKTSVGVILRLPGTRNWKPVNRDADGIGRLVSVETHASQRVSVPDAASALDTALLSASEYQRASVAVESAVPAPETFAKYGAARPLLRRANQMFEAGKYEKRHTLAGGLTRDLRKRGLTLPEVLGVMLGVGIEDTPNPGCLAALDKWTPAQIAADVARVYAKAGITATSRSQSGTEGDGTRGEQNGPVEGKSTGRSDESSPTRQNEKGRSLVDETSAISAVPESRFGTAYWDQQQKRLDITAEVRHVHFAEFVADQCGRELRHVQGVGWFKWNGKYWEATGDLRAAYQAVTDASGALIRRAADNPSDLAWCVPASNKMLVNDVRRKIVAEMAVLPQLHATVDEMDAKRHLLTFRNGTVDLRTGELVPHRPEHMLTQCTQVDYVPEAECPRWDRFVEEIFPGDEELQRYYQTWIGMSVTGEVKDHVLGVWYGDFGRNGKGVTVRTLQKVFGPRIIREVPFSMFENVRGQQPHTELVAGLRGARMVVAQEGNEGTPMNTALLKNFSGGDRISTRHLHGKQFDFEPTFTLVLVTNNLPQFSAGGAALWARTKAIHFGVSFAGRTDPELEPTVQGLEAEGVAAWVVRGAVRYYQKGLKDAESVVKATEHHKERVDPLRLLIGDLFDFVEGHRVLRSEFNAQLKKWRGHNEVKAGLYTPSWVKDRLLSTGNVTEVRSGKLGALFEGVRLTAQYGGVLAREFDLIAVPTDETEEMGEPEELQEL
ncbi:phage/plasmid primase, P4 family [Streptomyces europaeiscabiei]|uniref:Phage/plasmid primase, P4 family n=1 Tax=Streptomyces europaeiscabiei TaxID=146819 RepID=A0ABU4NE43_9ACTN|nr:phage/plasmid primase, P4 family [Streptomyces europaeiscabiei]MDX3541324.1 phage/plasmid primase, P4 family [Streptomyces europaeiscabiei]MDX3551665.1 phage/plasmid primase, P4 family [Streptomyces europaeiscabiei]MDX3699904.1 phage/plasmid primase, P4 family [Streptomyces europaeiscabiei]